MLIIIIIAASSFRRDTPWEMHVIDNTLQGADGVKLSDVNHDGYPDLIVGWEESGVTRLYFHPGYDQVSGDWNFIEVPSPGVEDALLADIDNDGFQDIITLSEGRTNRVDIHWAPADMSDYFKSEQWQSETIEATIDQGAWMFSAVIDVLNDGQQDLIIGSKRMAGEKDRDQAMVGWLEIPEEPRDVKEWKLHKISDAGWIMSIKILDMNKDGYDDVLLSDRKFSSKTGVRWLENPGDTEDAMLYHIWHSHMLGQEDTEPMFLTVDDWDGDGLEDVICADLNTSIYYYKREDESGRNWNVSQIPKAPFGSLRGKAVEIADITGDGNKEMIMSFETGSNQSEGRSCVTAAIPQNTSAENSWKYLDISGGSGDKFDLLQLIDMDGDGDQDILTCEEGEINEGVKRKGLGVIWYENPL